MVGFNPTKSAEFIGIWLKTLSLENGNFEERFERDLKLKKWDDYEGIQRIDELFLRVLFPLLNKSNKCRKKHKNKKGYSYCLSMFSVKRITTS